MNRLLFAAARDARIYWAEDTHCQFEQPCNLSHAQRHPSYYRVHPDDAYLQYGPVSTALRQWAMAGDIPVSSNKDSVYVSMAHLVIDKEIIPYSLGIDGSSFADHLDNLLLFLAELLADEGL